MSDFLSSLNNNQRAAVEYCEGPQLIIAGAGSGKTRVLTYKIAYLLLKGLKPWNILALTFTNKAANEMKERIAKIVGEETARMLNMGTFHSIFSRILRIEAEHLGFTSNYTIYDETDSRSLIKSITKELNLDDKIYKPATVHAKISMAKNHLILANDYENTRNLMQRDAYDRTPDVVRIYRLYQERCKNANAMDFDDLLVMTYMLFKNNEQLRQKYAERFSYVLVDEYQDTNSVQQKILWLLTKDHQNICVVGDDAQSIYGFRGANIDNILDFQQIYSRSKLFKLEQNYRSTQNIVNAANSLILHNQRQIRKDVFSENESGERLQLREAYSDREEAAIVCNEIMKIKRREKGDYSQFAILYRTNAQSRTFEEEMRKHAIPYRIFGGLSFYQRKEIKDVLAYFRLAVNPNDEEAFKRVINYPKRGIGTTTVNKIIDVAHQNDVSLWDVVSGESHVNDAMRLASNAKIKPFVEIIKSFIARIDSENAFDLGQEIIKESGIRADLMSDKDPEAETRRENVEELLNAMQEFVASRAEEGRDNAVYLSDFLQEVALMTDLDSEGNDASRVVLMTVHAAKGLEFNTVFVVGLEENIFPSQLSVNNMRELEEERRLLYVAITRAQKHCYLTYAKTRWRYGHMEFGVQSRFIKDIDPHFISTENERASEDNISKRQITSSFQSQPFFRQRELKEVRKESNATPTNSHRLRSIGVTTNKNEAPKQYESAVLADGTTLHNGDRVKHMRFGLGTIINIEGEGDSQKATVEFDNLGRKQLLLKFARLSLI